MLIFSPSSKKNQVVVDGKNQVDVAQKRNKQLN